MITATKFYKENRKDILTGLKLGLLTGLILGLLPGPSFRLLAGLLIGLSFGLLTALLFGLLPGLSYGLSFGLSIILTNFSEALPFVSGFYPVLFLILGIILLVEVWYWLYPKEKVKKKDRFTHTLKRKIEAFIEVMLGLSAITQVYILTREIDFLKNFPIILKWIGYIGVGIIGLCLIALLIYLWIKLNSLKYRKRGGSK
jgi:hypothetical protein